MPELIERYDPALTTQRPGDPGLSLDIAAWRELAWRNAKRLRAAPSRRARRRVAAGIERHASVMARRIRAAFPSRGRGGGPGRALRGRGLAAGSAPRIVAASPEPARVKTAGRPSGEPTVTERPPR